MAEPHVLFAHILAQTRQNVELLIAHKQISEADGEAILTKLAVNAADKHLGSSIMSLTQQTQRLDMSTGPPKVEARAVWTWTSEDPNDLTFEAGEIIEIITETNADWWTGRSRSGKQGLFPSNYVERLPPRSVSPIFVPEPRQSMASSIRSRGSASGEPRYASPVQTQPMSAQSYGASPESQYSPAGGYYAPPAGPPPGGMSNYTGRTSAR